MSDKAKKNTKINTKIMCYGLLFLFTLMIFFIAEVIRATLITYELSSIFVSFCAGFILFIPLITLVLHPLAFNQNETKTLFHFSAFVANLGLVVVVQVVCFLIWMTDAIAVYSIYVDQSSFLAKAFNINTHDKADFSRHFYWTNLLLAWFFACLTLVIGILPCIISRIKNIGVVSNFVIAFSFAKVNKKRIILYGLLIAISIVLPLLYSKYLFLIVFPAILSLLFFQIVKEYLLFNSH